MAGDFSQVALPHERVLISSCLESDALLIFSKGLSPFRFAALLLSEWYLNHQQIFQTPHHGMNQHQAWPLIICLGLTEYEFGIFKKRAKQCTVLSEMRIEYLGSDVDSKQRLEILPKGGILAASSRTLVIDMLNGNLDPVIINGVLVFNSHRLISKANEIFALTLMRDSRDTSFFVKAFSDDPGEMIRGFNQTERTMRLLRLKKLLLAPRGAPKVSSFLDNPIHSGIYEYKLLPFTHAAERAKNLLINLIETGLAELLDAFPDVSNLVELHTTGRETLYQDLNNKSFSEEHFIFSKLSGSGSRKLKDIQIFRSLLEQLTHCQAGTFYYNLVQITRSASGDSSWLLLPAMDELLRIAKSRVYKTEIRDQSIFVELNIEMDSRLTQLANIIESERSVSSNLPSKRVLVVVESTKRAIDVYQTLTSGPELAALSAVKPLFQNSNHKTQAGTGVVSRQVESESSALEVAWRKQFVHLPFSPESQEFTDHLELKGSTNLLLDIMVPGDDSNGEIEDYMVSKTPDIAVLMGLKMEWIRETEIGCGRNSMLELCEREPLLAQVKANNDESSSSHQTTVITHQQGPESTKGITSDADAGNQSITMRKAKRELESPQNKTTSVRKKSKQEVISLKIDTMITETKFPKQSHKIKIFILGTIDSDEEVRFNTSVAAELLAWDNLIHQKESLLIFEDDRNLNTIGSMTSLDERLKYMLSDGLHMPSGARKAGGGRAMMLKEVKSRIMRRQKEQGQETLTSISDAEIQSMDMKDLMALIKPVVIVDVREFRSALPFRLWSSGLRLIPVTLTIGDYILSNEIVVERKSVPDLVQSLSSGRLFRQCERMVRKFKKPVLFIELGTCRSAIDTISEDGIEELQTKGNARGEAVQTKRTRKISIKAKVSPRSAGGTSSFEPYQLIAKLVVLIIHFPMLRTIWSLDEAFGSDMFWSLKEGREQPNMAVITDSDIVIKDESANKETARSYRRALDSTNFPAIDLLQKLPLISTRALDRIVRRLDNLAQLLALSDNEVYDVMGREEGRAWLETINDDSWLSK